MQDSALPHDVGAVELWDGVVVMVVVIVVLEPDPVSSTEAETGVSAETLSVRVVDSAGNRQAPPLKIEVSQFSDFFKKEIALSQLP